MVSAVEHFKLTVGSAEVRRDSCGLSANFQKKKKVFIAVVEFKKGLERLHRTASKAESAPEAGGVKRQFSAVSEREQQRAVRSQ